MMQRGQSRPRSRSRQFGYPLSFRGQVRGAQGLLPCFPPTALVPWRLPSLARVLASPVPRGHRYDEGATTSRSRILGRLFVSRPRSTRFLLVRARLVGAPGSAEVRPRPGPLFSRLSLCRRALTWTRTGSHRFPGDPSHAFAPVQDPGRIDGASPCRRRQFCPRKNHCEGSSDTNIEATHAASASAAYASRTALPPSRQGSLPTGWLAFAGRESNPLDHSERFQSVTSCSSPSPELFLSQGSCNRRSFCRASWSSARPCLLSVLRRLLLPRRRRLAALHGLVLLATIALLRNRHDRGVHHLAAAGDVPLRIQMLVEPLEQLLD